MTGGSFISLGKALLEPEPGEEQEFTRLFLSPEGAPCPPWQSVYGETKRLLGPEHHSALAWFRRYGLEPATDTEPADHAGLLLIFYQQMLEAGAPAEELALYRRQHLDWIVPFCASIERATSAGSFQQMARQTAQLLLTEAAPGRLAIAGQTCMSISCYREVPQAAEVTISA